MKRAEMEQLKRIPDEIKSIEQTLKNPRMEYVNVYYKDYRTGKGIPKSRSEYDYDHQEWNRLKKKLRRKIKTLASLVIRAEAFIDSIEDSEIRTMLRLYYINGETQEEIGRKMHYDRSTISKKIEKFWDEQSNHTIHEEKAI